MIPSRSLVFAAFFCLILQGCAKAYQSKSKTPQQAVPLPQPRIFETDYLEATPGYRGNVLGAEIIDAEIGDEQQIIEINLPIDPDQVDQVRVMSPSGEKLKQTKEAEILRDYESDTVGLKIFLPRRESPGFRLRLIDNVEAD